MYAKAIYRTVMTMTPFYIENLMCMGKECSLGCTKTNLSWILIWKNTELKWNKNA